MGRAVPWSCFCVLSLIVFGYVAIPTTVALAAECASVDAPTFAIGDEWRWEGGTYPVVTRVVALEGDGSVVESNADPWCQDGCRYVRDRDGIAVNGTNPKGEAVYVTGLKLVEFPLAVGKEWSQRLDLRSQTTGAMQPLSVRWKVEACEEVKVKAGNFRAFRISWAQDGLGQRRWSGKATLWSPEVKAFVKRRVHTTDWALRDQDLVSYTLK